MTLSVTVGGCNLAAEQTKTQQNRPPWWSQLIYSEGLWGAADSRAHGHFQLLTGVMLGASLLQVLHNHSGPQEVKDRSMMFFFFCPQLLFEDHEEQTCIIHCIKSRVYLFSL